MVSFGSIGPELQGVVDGLKSSLDSVTLKLLGNEYSTNDVDWILDHLVIDKVNEEELLSEIYKELEATIESMAAPQVVLDMLCHYVSQLSRSGGYTSKDIWKAKLQAIGLDLASIAGVARQYGNTLSPCMNTVVAIR